jgi:enamidase
MSTLAVINIGELVSGDLERGVLEADTLLVADGSFIQVGKRDQVDLEQADIVLDAKGSTVIPGLLDSHVHITFGDYTPRQKAVDFIESYMHGGITTVFSAGEVHVPGAPKDPVGVKALAVAAQRCFQTFRPGGVKVCAGCLILQPGLEEDDFRELAQQGIKLAKLGFGQFAKAVDAEPLVRWAQKHGIIVMAHTGGVSIPGSSSIFAEDLLVLQPDVAGHANGGTTALTDEGVERLLRESNIVLQIVQAGNLRSALRIVGLARESGLLHRITIASDTPSGTGVMPLAVIKSVTEVASLGGIAPAQAIAMATGNVARVYGVNSGVIAVGGDADFLIVDAPVGSAAKTALGAMAIGDIPGISAVVIDGVVRAYPSRNTPAPSRLPSVSRRRGDGVAHA